VTQLTSNPRRVRREFEARHQRAGYQAAENVLRRGRHATPVGQGFGYLVGWTILGTLLPGSGLMAAGRRAAGGVILACTFLLCAGAGVWALTQADRNALISMGTDTDFLLVAAVGMATLGAIWIAVVITTHGALRRSTTLSAGQRALAIGLVLSLVGAIGVPSAAATRLALVHRDLMVNLFGGGPDRDKNSAAPQVEKVDPWATIPRVNVLMLGGDDGRGRVGVRPDTVILASIDTKTGNTVLFNIPRQLEKAPFPAGSAGHRVWPYGFGPTIGGQQYNCGQTGELCFFNAIWSTAEDNKQHFPGVKNPGLLATREAVEGVLGLHVDYYGKLNLKGFEDFVDAIGGVTIKVRRNIPIGGGTNTLTGGKNPIYGWINKGKRHLDGKDALWFARSREGSDNWERMQRQQCVVGALARQADPVTVAKAYPKLARSAKKNISTDVPLDQVDALVQLGLRVKEGKVTSMSLTPEVIGSAANPDFPRIHRLVQKALRDSTKPTPTPTVTPGTSGTTNPTTSPTRRPRTSKTATPGTPQDLSAIC
jgi:LCP family protein required for cell wall assembly